MDTRGLPGKVKAWCGKCYMTFENGHKSLIVQDHVKLRDCDVFPCNKPAKYRCIRRFRNTNSANRHVYCYTSEQVKDWDESLKVVSLEELNMSALVISDTRACEELTTSASQHHDEIEDSTTLSELMERVKTVLGKEHSRKALARVKQTYKRSGFTSAQAFRIARHNEGSWDFLCRDFVKTCPEVTTTSHVLKHLLS